MKTLEQFKAELDNANDAAIAVQCALHRFAMRLMLKADDKGLVDVSTIINERSALSDELVEESLYGN